MRNMQTLLAVSNVSIFVSMCLGSYVCIHACKIGGRGDETRNRYSNGNEMVGGMLHALFLLHGTFLGIANHRPRSYFTRYV